MKRKRQGKSRAKGAAVKVGNTWWPLTRDPGPLVEPASPLRRELMRKIQARLTAMDGEAPGGSQASEGT